MNDTKTNAPTLEEEGVNRPDLLAEDSTSPDWERLKVELNTLTIMWGPPNVTIAQAEEAMLKYIGHLNACSCKMANVELSHDDERSEKELN